jgi:hypothetical protein
VIAYESHLRAQKSDKIIDKDTLKWMYVAKGLDTSAWKDIALTAKKKTLQEAADQEYMDSKNPNG